MAKNRKKQEQVPDPELEQDLQASALDFETELATTAEKDSPKATKGSRGRGASKKKAAAVVDDDAQVKHRRMRRIPLVLPQIPPEVVKARKEQERAEAWERFNASYKPVRRREEPERKAILPQLTGKELANAAADALFSGVLPEPVGYKETKKEPEVQQEVKTPPAPNKSLFAPSRFSRLNDVLKKHEQAQAAAKAAAAAASEEDELYADYDSIEEIDFGHYSDPDIDKGAPRMDDAFDAENADDYRDRDDDVDAADHEPTSKVRGAKAKAQAKRASKGKKAAKSAHSAQRAQSAKSMPQTKADLATAQHAPEERATAAAAAPAAKGSTAAAQLAASQEAANAEEAQKQAARQSRPSIENALGTAAGTANSADGSYTDEQGNIHTADGTIYAPDGTIYSPDGTTFTPDGTIFKADGTIFTPDGRVYMPDGTVFMPDGTVYQPDAAAAATTEAAGAHNMAYNAGITDDSDADVGTADDDDEGAVTRATLKRHLQERATRTTEQATFGKRVVRNTRQSKGDAANKDTAAMFRNYVKDKI